MIRKGAVPAKDLITGIRQLTKADLAKLEERRSVPVVQRLRDPHHRLARNVAMGLKLHEAATNAGYSYASLRLLQKDPSFNELVEHYRKLVVESFVESQDAYFDLLTSNMLKAERHIAERIEEKEEAGELLSVREAHLISRDAADRAGYGKKSTNLNVNVDFAARLERASQRSAKVIEVVHPPPPARPHNGREVPQSLPSRSSHPRVLRRA